MDFQSEAYKNFLDSHTRLNNYIKISIAAVDYLYNSKNDKKELSELINTLILRTGERWTPRIINEPQSELFKLKNDMTKSAIIWVYSAFDVFFKESEGLLSNYFNAQENENENINDDDNKEHKIIELYKKLNWSTNKIEKELIVLNVSLPKIKTENN